MTHPTNTGVRYTGAGREIWHSYDGGKTWVLYTIIPASMGTKPRASHGEVPHTTDLRERVAGAIESATNKPGERVSIAQAEAALNAVSKWFTDNGYYHADGVLGIGQEPSR